TGSAGSSGSDWRLPDPTLWEAAVWWREEALTASWISPTERERRSMEAAMSWLDLAISDRASAIWRFAAATSAVASLEERTEVVVVPNCWATSVLDMTMAIQARIMTA